MILEVALLTVRPGTQAAFEAAFAKAQRLLAGVEGYLAHELRQSVESEQQYALLIEWCALEDPTLGFRKVARVRALARAAAGLSARAAARRALSQRRGVARRCAYVQRLN